MFGYSAQPPRMAAKCMYHFVTAPYGEPINGFGMQQQALNETKYRIRHHLTEYPVPRGRGPAPARPFLSFQDLVEKYSPGDPTEHTDLGFELERLRIGPEAPFTCTSQGDSDLSVQTRLPSTSSLTLDPNSHYTPPLTLTAPLAGDQFMQVHNTSKQNVGPQLAYLASQAGEGYLFPLSAAGTGSPSSSHGRSTQKP
ncbi:hypothetical protein RhiJN_17958 [Ceratobasidium sp. AG-Ba]|nr:hypothetical protein RhiJN_17958 [Ceratobasidium sp. AG-Ba]